MYAGNKKVEAGQIVCPWCPRKTHASNVYTSIGGHTRIARSTGWPALALESAFDLFQVHDRDSRGKRSGDVLPIIDHHEFALRTCAISSCHAKRANRKSCRHEIPSACMYLEITQGQTCHVYRSLDQSFRPTAFLQQRARLAFLPHFAKLQQSSPTMLPADDLSASVHYMLHPFTTRPRRYSVPDAPRRSSLLQIARLPSRIASFLSWPFPPPSPLSSSSSISPLLLFLETTVCRIFASRSGQ